jgi:hypothetical protein
VAATISFVSVAGGRHALLRRARLWHDLSTGFVLGALFGRDPVDSVGVDAGKVLAEALAGQAALVV